MAQDFGISASWCSVNHMARTTTPLPRDLLHYRACLVVLCLYYCEYIKTTIIETLERAYPTPPKKGSQNGGGMKIYRALEILLRDQLITPAERDELISLVQYRNNVAHRIHRIAAGLQNAGPDVRGGSAQFDPQDAASLNRLRHYADKIVVKLEVKHRVPYEASAMLFERTRDAYEAELVRLAGELGV